MQQKLPFRFSKCSSFKSYIFKRKFFFLVLACLLSWNSTQVIIKKIFYLIKLFMNKQEIRLMNVILFSTLKFCSQILLERVGIFLNKFNSLSLIFHKFKFQTPLFHSFLFVIFFFFFIIILWPNTLFVIDMNDNNLFIQDEVEITCHLKR